MDSDFVEKLAQRTRDLNRVNEELRREIVEREHAKAALRESESRFRAIFEQAGDAMVLTDSEGRIVDANDVVCKLLGYTRDELLTMSLPDIDPSFIPAHHTESLMDPLEAGHGITFETTNRCKDGRIVPTEVRLVAIEFEDRTLYLGVGRDLTQRKEAQRQIRHLSSAVEQTSEGVAVVDLDGHVMSINNAFAEIHGYSPDELIGKHLSIFHTAEQMPSVEAAIRQGRETDHFQGELWHVRRDGTVFPTSMNCSLLRDESDAPIGLIGVMRDITERKEAEEEREKLIAKLQAQNAELERFTYTVSHDLKSPLITIKGYLGLLQEDVARGDSEAVEDDAARMVTAADRMEQLLNELLELSRVGRLVNPSEHVGLGDLAREAAELVGGQINQRGVRVEIAPDLPVVFGDRPRLTEVFQNLIDNAVKYMGDQADPLIEIGARIDGDETVCHVRDNGIGIAPSFQEKVFNLFDKLDPKSEGVGIGLALVKRIVEVHRGRIWVESDGPGQGSTFYFTLPPKRETLDDVGAEA